MTAPHADIARPGTSLFLTDRVPLYQKRIESVLARELEIDGLAAGHAARADGIGEYLQHFQSCCGGNSRGCLGQHFEGARLQGIAGEDRRCFVERAMTGGPAAAQIVVVHGGQVVVHQAVDVDEFD